ncbi:MAG: hypothetical protein AAGA12_02805 [Pseudomonadota bacterium]
MKPLVICSVHALLDLAPLESAACNAVFESHRIAATWGPSDIASINDAASVLDVLNHLPGSSDLRAKIVRSYLEFLNDQIWASGFGAYQSVSAALADPKGYQRPTGFVSDYPMLTTNLARAAALQTNATKLGTIIAASDPFSAEPVSEALAICAQSLGVSHQDVEVLVARRRDYSAARSLGMRPRFVDELRHRVTSLPTGLPARHATVPKDDARDLINHAISLSRGEVLRA